MEAFGFVSRYATPQSTCKSSMVPVKITSIWASDTPRYHIKLTSYINYIPFKPPLVVLYISIISQFDGHTVIPYYQTHALKGNPLARLGSIHSWVAPSHSWAICPMQLPASKPLDSTGSARPDPGRAFPWDPGSREMPENVSSRTCHGKGTFHAGL